MEYQMKCNVCGKVFCYTDEDLKQNATNAGMGALSALGSLASALGGGTIFHTQHLQGQSDRYTDKIVDYDQCPYCHSRDISVFSGNTENTKTVKTVNINTSASTESLLKRVTIFLEDGEWGTADAYCEACLDRDPELAEAYLGKLMAELQVKTQGELKNQPEPFDNSANYRKAIRFADAELKNTLIEYIEYINNRNENTRKDEVLCDAKAKMIGNAIADYEEALSLFASIPGWEDADEQRSICQSKIAELKANEEVDRLERERLAEIERKKAEEEAEAARIKAKKNKKIAAIVVPVLAVLIVAATIISNSLQKRNTYENALSLMEAGQYDEAVEAFASLDGYKDSAELLRLAEYELPNLHLYEDALSYLEARKYKEAYTAFETLGDYRDAKEYYDCFKWVPEQIVGKWAVTTLSYDEYGRVVRADTRGMTDNIHDKEKTYLYNDTDGSLKIVYTYVESQYQGENQTKTETAIFNADRTEANYTITRNYVEGHTQKYTRYFTYDKYGNVLTAKSVDAETGELEYNRKYVYEYDLAGNLLTSYGLAETKDGQWSKMWNTQEYSYNTDGLLSSVSYVYGDVEKYSYTIIYCPIIE